MILYPVFASKLDLSTAVVRTYLTRYVSGHNFIEIGIAIVRIENAQASTPEATVELARLRDYNQAELPEDTNRLGWKEFAYRSGDAHEICYFLIM